MILENENHQVELYLFTQLYTEDNSREQGLVLPSNLQIIEKDTIDKEGYVNEFKLDLSKLFFKYGCTIIQIQNAIIISHKNSRLRLFESITLFNNDFYIVGASMDNVEEGLDVFVNFGKKYNQKFADEYAKLLHFYGYLTLESELNCKTIISSTYRLGE